MSALSSSRAVVAPVCRVVERLRYPARIFPAHERPRGLRCRTLGCPPWLSISRGDVEFSRCPRCGAWTRQQVPHIARSPYFTARWETAR